MSDETEDPVPAEKPPKKKRGWKWYRPNLKTVVIGGPLLAAAVGVPGRMYLDSVDREKAREAFLEAFGFEDDSAKRIRQAIGRHTFKSLDVEEYADEALAAVIKDETISPEEKLQIVKDLLAKNTRQKDPDYGQALSNAVHDGHIEIVKALLEAGADPNVEKAYAEYVLGICKNPEIVKLLLERGISPSAFGKALLAAADDHNLEIINMLLDAGADKDESGRLLLSKCEDPALVKLLLERGVDPNGVCPGSFGSSTPFHTAVDYRYVSGEQDSKKAHEIATLMLEYGANVHSKDGLGRTPLHCCQHVEVAELLVAAGADVHAKDDSLRTTLHWSHNAAMAKFLLDHGVDPKAQDKEGNTPLHYIRTDHSLGYQNRDVDVTKILLEHGANPNALNKDGQTPFFNISSPFFDMLELTKLLLAAGADPKVRDKKNGSTPLHGIDRSHRGIRGYKGVQEAIKLLVAAGADINARDNDGDTPLHSVNIPEIAKALLDAGANPTLTNNVGKTALDDINDYIKVHGGVNKRGNRSLSDSELESLEKTKTLLEEAIEKWNAEHPKASQAEKVEARRAGRERGASPDR